VAESGIYALQGAATAIDNETGKVVAIVGGRDQEVTTYTLNRAFQSFRQPGSAIKPILVYAPALEKGYTSNSVVYDIDVSKAKEPGVDVLTLTGPAMSLRNGVERSRNGVAWSVYVDITPEYGMSFLTKMRFDNIVPGDYYPATALGGFTYGATTEEMAGAYATLVNGGLYRNPTCLVSMLDKNGGDIYREAEETRVYSEDKSMVMVDILKGVVSHGTAAGMGWRSEIEAAGKTGTTNDNKDVWFVGLTPKYVMATWYGYNENEPMDDYNSYYIYKNKGSQKGHPGASAFAEVMDTIQADLSEEEIVEWEKPDSVEIGAFCTISGDIPTDGCPRGTGYYKVGVQRGVCTGIHATDPAA